jgi:MarR family transcriptional regulator, organic hydroperoxide resistance regulator
VSGVLEPHGVTPQQYNVLRILRGAGDKPLPTLAIRRRMVEQTPGITRLLDRLEAKGWVERTRCTEDRRQVLCRITPPGRDLLSRLDAPMRGVDKTALSGLEGGRIDQLIELLDGVRAAHSQPDELQAKETEEEEQL